MDQFPKAPEPAGRAGVAGLQPEPTNSPVTHGSFKDSTDAPKTSRVNQKTQGHSYKNSTLNPAADSYIPIQDRIQEILDNMSTSSGDEIVYDNKKASSIRKGKGKVQKKSINKRNFAQLASTQDIINQIGFEHLSIHSPSSPSTNFPVNPIAAGASTFEQPAMLQSGARDRLQMAKLERPDFFGVQTGSQMGYQSGYQMSRQHGYQSGIWKDYQTANKGDYPRGNQMGGHLGSQIGGQMYGQIAGTNDYQHGYNTGNQDRKGSRFQGLFQSRYQATGKMNNQVGYTTDDQKDYQNDHRMALVGPQTGYNHGHQMGHHNDYQMGYQMRSHLAMSTPQPVRTNSALPDWLSEFDYLKPTPTVVPGVNKSSKQLASAQQYDGKGKGKEVARDVPYTQQSGNTTTQAKQDPSVRMAQKLLSLTATDGLTMVGARKSIWTEAAVKDNDVEWPTQAELEEYGRQRPRCLPPPCHQQLDPKVAKSAYLPVPVPTSGPDVPRQLRKLTATAKNPTADGLTRGETYQARGKLEEFKLDEANGFLRELLEDIDMEQ